MEPWKTNLEPSKLTWSCTGWLWVVQVVTGDSQEKVMIFRDKQTLHHNIYIIIILWTVLAPVGHARYDLPQRLFVNTENVTAGTLWPTSVTRSCLRPARACRRERRRRGAASLSSATSSPGSFVLHSQLEISSLAACFSSAQHWCWWPCSCRGRPTSQRPPPSTPAWCGRSTWSSTPRPSSQFTSSPPSSSPSLAWLLLCLSYWPGHISTSGASFAGICLQLVLLQVKILFIQLPRGPFPYRIFLKSPFSSGIVQWERLKAMPLVDDFTKYVQETDFTRNKIYFSPVRLCCFCSNFDTAFCEILTLPVAMFSTIPKGS